MTTTKDGAAKFDFDPDSLRRKYREERDKRIRPDGLTQYVGMTGDLADFAADPFADPSFVRDPLSEEIDVLVLGGGITGLMTAAALRKAGIDNFRMIDKAGDFGGTWYWNRYPGIRCDVEAYVYMPLLEELNYAPSEKYTKGSEILAHCQAIARHFDLYPRAVPQTEVRNIRWDDPSARWIVETDRNDVLKARFIAIGTGPISKPKLPRIPGIDKSKGQQFHTARWEEAVQGWAALLDATAVDQSGFEAECTPGYLNNEGDRNAGKSLFANIFAPGILSISGFATHGWRTASSRMLNSRRSNMIGSTSLLDARGPLQ